MILRERAGPECAREEFRTTGAPWPATAAATLAVMTARGARGVRWVPWLAAAGAVLLAVAFSVRVLSEDAVPMGPWAEPSPWARFRPVFEWPDAATSWALIGAFAASLGIGTFVLRLVASGREGVAPFLVAIGGLPLVVGDAGMRNSIAENLIHLRPMVPSNVPESLGWVLAEGWAVRGVGAALSAALLLGLGLGLAALLPRPGRSWSRRGFLVGLASGAPLLAVFAVSGEHGAWLVPHVSAVGGITALVLAGGAALQTTRDKGLATAFTMTACFALATLAGGAVVSAHVANAFLIQDCGPAECVIVVSYVIAALAPVAGVESWAWAPGALSLTILLLSQLGKQHSVRSLVLAGSAAGAGGLIFAVDVIATEIGPNVLREEPHLSWTSTPGLSPLTRWGRPGLNAPRLVAMPDRIVALDGSGSVNRPYDPAQREALTRLLKRTGGAHSNMTISGSRYVPPIPPRMFGAHEDWEQAPPTEVTIAADSRLRPADVLVLAEAMAATGVEAMTLALEDPVTFPRDAPNRSPASWFPWVRAYRGGARFLVRVPESTEGAPHILVHVGARGFAGSFPSRSVKLETERPERGFPLVLTEMEDTNGSRLEAMRPIIVTNRGPRPYGAIPVRLEPTSEATLSSLVETAVGLTPFNLQAVLSPRPSDVAGDDQ